MVAIPRRTKVTTVDGLTAMLSKFPGTIPCPLSKPDFVKLYMSAFPSQLLDEIRDVHAAGYELTYNNYVPVATLIIDKPDDPLGFWHIQHSALEKRLPKFPRHDRNTMRQYVGKHRNIVLFCRDDLVNLFGEKSDDILAWCNERAIMDAQAREAITVVDQLFTMASTAGQLHRMVPELMHYMGDAYKRQVAEQTKRSPLPDKWSSFDRYAVQRTLITIAKAHLMDANKVDTEAMNPSCISLTHKELELA